MPFRDYSVFDADALKAMGAAFDAAIVRLGIRPDDPLTSNVAARIAALASEGERDPNILCEGAVVGLRPKDERPD
jgi:hypothetical protein